MFSIIFLKEPYSPSHLIWMHSNKHSKQWSLFSTTCLKEPHPFPSHIRIYIATITRNSDPCSLQCVWKKKTKRSDSVLWQSHFVNRNVKRAKRQQYENGTKRLDYTAIVFRFRTVSWSSYSYPTGVVNRFTGPFWKNHTPLPSHKIKMHSNNH